ncbi:TetR/AcrR family transcriptional regulator [Streptomyces sp. GMY02]|uniref:TetR/AcrR family transcriptional regulator n=1 Tax=Streptomyces sp. GMY02 TaxID=1333528 RepID=UPI001C2BCE41|nr:TetR/AcrR family transcriptional regulator [Streptomyces sp. GMY02]QXE33337.1 TetR/AcrR family transcriptional regulator [Streptomyces sp. GMY02]
MTTFRRARSEEQRETRRQAILDTAAAMLDEMPVSKISLNELSRRVGLAKSPLLRYFESREAILLELLDRTWKQWLARLPEQLTAGIGTDGTAQQRGARLADTLTRSLAEQRALCDLLAAQAGVLEHNVSTDVAIRYKHAAVDNVTVLAGMVRDHLPELGADAGQLSAQAILITGAVRTHSVPSPSMLAAYDVDPSLAEQRLDFTTAMRTMLTTLITGTLARPQPEAPEAPARRSRRRGAHH